MAQASRLEAKLAACWPESNYYEAQQICRTLYYRLSNQKQYDHLLQLLYDSAVRLLQAGQLSSGSDLAELFGQTLEKARTPSSIELLSKIRQLVSMLPKARTHAEDVNERVDHRAKVVSELIKWSKSVAVRRIEKRRGLCALHFELANVFAQERDYSAARNHFLLSDRGEEFASFLVSWLTSEEIRGEEEYFGAQAVLQLLCLRRWNMANTFFTVYTSHFAGIFGEPPAFKMPILNFIFFLLQTVKTRNLSYYTVLVDKYQPVINRDPLYRQYLDKIGQNYLGLPPPVKPNQFGIFGGLLKGLMGNHETVKESSSEDSAVPDEESPAADEDYATAEEEGGGRQGGPSSAPHSQTPMDLDDLD